MGFRFQKRIKIFPGVRLNISKSGVSTSIGGKGFTLNVKGNKARTTVGIPGTGISYRGGQKPIFTEPSGQPAPAGIPTWLGLIIAGIALYFFICILS